MSALELSTPPLGVIACLAEPDALERLETPVGALALRVAPDERNLWCRAHERERVLAAVREAALAADPTALVADVSAGWSARLLAGAGARAAFATQVAFDPGQEGTRFLQGAVHGVSARSLVGEDFALVLLVAPAACTFDRYRPAAWGPVGEPDGALLDRILASAPVAA